MSESANSFVRYWYWTERKPNVRYELRKSTRKTTYTSRGMRMISCHGVGGAARPACSGDEFVEFWLVRSGSFGSRSFEADSPVTRTLTRCADPLSSGSRNNVDVDGE